MIKKIIILVLSFALFVGGVVIIADKTGLFESLQTSLDSSKDAKETTKTSSSTVASTLPSAQNILYLDEENRTGYRTMNGLTYFFKYFEPGDLTATARIYLNQVKPYSTYSVNAYYSCEGKDGLNSVGWTKSKVLDESYYISPLDYLGRQYVSYTVISNCADPASVLADLNDNVFNTNCFPIVYNSADG